MKTALIHDWLTGMRGGESCLEVLCELYPSADIFTLLHKKGSVSKTIEGKRIETSFVQKLPFQSRYRNFLPLFPIAIESFDLGEYDVVISVNHCVAKGVITNPDTVHICYCLTPMRYVWDMYHSYFKGFAGRYIVPFFANYLRTWDVASSIRVEYFISISNYVSARILKYYGRDSEVVYPPVDCSSMKFTEKVDDYYLIVSAFAPYKRVDLAIQAFNQTGAKLIIIGTGQDEKRLKKMAKNNIEFLGWQSDEQVREYYSKCKALIFPGLEDFGIVPLEVQASGRPVIAYGKGGACETVIPVNPKGTSLNMDDPAIGDVNRATGVFFYEQTVPSLVAAIKEFEKIEDSFDSKNIRTQALKFDLPVFRSNLKNCIEKCIKR